MKIIKRICLYLLLILIFPFGMLNGIIKSLHMWFSNLCFSEVHSKWLEFKELWKTIKEETK